MVITAPKQESSRWVLRDSIAAVLLFAVTAAVVFWQNAHVAALFDVSYILNTAERIAAGQMPYRHFPLPHAPFTFFIQAAIIRLTGRVFFHHVIYAALVGGLGTVLTWRIALNALRGRIAAAWPIALLVAAPLTVLGIYCILPNPEYDCDCGFWIVVAIWMLQRLDRTKNVFFGFVTGAMVCAPLFFKQNMGLPFLLVVFGAILSILAAKIFPRTQKKDDFPGIRAFVAVLAGAGATLFAATLTLHWTAGLRNYYHWTVAYAGQRRMPGLGLMFGVYRDPRLLWTVPCAVAALVLLRTRVGERLWARVLAFTLLAVPFLMAFAALLVYYDDADPRGDNLLALWPILLLLSAAVAIVNLFRLRQELSLRLFLPLILLVAVNSTFLSQQLWGSTYGIWPLLVLLVSELLAFLDGFLENSASRRLVPLLAALVSATLLVCGGLYTFSEDRLSYADLPDGPPAHSTFPELAGLSTPGPYLPEIDELLRYAKDNIPADDGIVLIPGEEPFYFASGRPQRFPVQFFDPTIDPYSPAETESLVQSQNIRWLIVKRDVQTKADPTPDHDELMRLLTPEFAPAAHLRGYDVYHR